MDESEKEPLLSQQQKVDSENDPPLSKWKRVCLTKSIWYPADYPLWHYNNLQILFFPWIIVDIFIILTLYYFHIQAFPNIPEKYRLIVEILEYTTGLYALLNYFLARITDPGFLPFNWSLTKKKTFTQEEMRSGIAITSEQADWAKSHDSPNRAWFSGREGYFILRGDHYCPWVGNFIGLKNHKYFLIGTYSITLYVIFSFILIIYLQFIGKFTLHWFMKCILLGGGLYYLSISITQSLLHSIQISHNSTTIEVMTGNYKKYYHGSRMEGWEEICGLKKYMWLWWLPCQLPQKVDGFSFEPDPNWQPVTWLKDYPYLLRSGGSRGIQKLYEQFHPTGKGLENQTMPQDEETEKENKTQPPLL